MSIKWKLEISLVAAFTAYSLAYVLGGGLKISLVIGSYISSFIQIVGKIQLLCQLHYYFPLYIKGLSIQIVIFIIGYTSYYIININI